MDGALTLRDPTSGAACEVDGIALAPVCLDTVHRKIHEGGVFTASTPPATWPNGQARNISLVVPADVVVHGTFSVFVDGDCYLTFGHSPNGASGGNVLDNINRNRASANTADITIRDLREIFTPGIQLSERFVPGGSPPSSNGQFSPAFEWVLPEGEYILRVISHGASRETSVQVFWYEEAA